MNNLLPVITFFVVYKIRGLMQATAAMIILATLQLIIDRIKKGKFETINLVSTILIIIFGSATLFLQDEMFIKWKVTIMYWVIALIFLSTQMFSSKPLIQRLAEKSISISSKHWARLNISWFIFTLSMGFLNLYVAYNYATNFWVNFKLFGTFSLSLIFLLLQTFIISKVLHNNPNNHISNQ